jgi:hypothetical protein
MFLIFKLYPTIYLVDIKMFLIFNKPINDLKIKKEESPTYE